MANPYRGEVALRFGEVEHTARLSLQALAEIEQRLELKSIADLFDRLIKARFSSNELVFILEQGLIAAGMAAEEASEAVASLGFPEAVEAVSELLEATFTPLVSAKPDE